MVETVIPPECEVELRYEFEPNPKKKQSFCQTAELGNVPATPTFLRYDLFD